MGPYCFLGLLALSTLLAAGPSQDLTKSPPGPSAGPRDPRQPGYQNPALPSARRVDDLLSRMTLEEKVAQMLCIWNAKRQITDTKGHFDPAHLPEWFRVGIGRI